MKQALLKVKPKEKDIQEKKKTGRVGSLFELSTATRE